MTVKEFLENMEPVKNNILDVMTMINMSTDNIISCLFIDAVSCYTYPSEKAVHISNFKMEENDYPYNCKGLYEVLKEEASDEYSVILDYYLETENGTIILTIDDFNIMKIDITESSTRKKSAFYTIYISADKLSNLYRFDNENKKEEI